MSKVLIFVDHSSGKLKKIGEELLTLAQGQEISVCAIGENANSLAEELNSWGITNFFTANFNNYNPEVFLQFFSKIYEQVKPDIILSSSNSIGRDVFPRFAAKFDAAFMSDCTEVSLTPKLTVRRPMYSGKCSAEVVFADDSCKIILLRPNQMEVNNPGASSSVSATEVSLEISSLSTALKSVESSDNSTLDLTEANIIVSGGRGLKDAEGFKILEKIAEPLKATIGASRAIVDLGWVPHSMQVGQTGKTVAPSLYIACGISGAIQHLAGMSESKVIVAINKDEKAPIFQKATYGIVGDIFEIAPHLGAELQKLTSQ